MSVTRRRFIVAGTMAAAAAGLADVPAVLAEEPRSRVLPAGIPDAVWADPLWQLTMADWEGQVGSSFGLIAGTRRMTRVTLDRVLDLAARQRPRPAAGQECFSLLFRGSKLKPFPQDVYIVDSAVFGRFKLLLVPVLARGKRNVFYEAVINRVTPAA